jgi:XTP/dITP diphosphohydrolase
VTPLIVATKNKGKSAEIKRRLLALFEIIDLNCLDRSIDIVEDADTFEGNALKKAETVAKETSLHCLSDDSGLEVDALNGRPGVHSARYGGEGLDDAGRCALLLKEMSGVPLEKRTARFRTVLVFIEPKGEPLLFKGSLEGRIAFEADGRHGFGYDPIFIPSGHDRTIAALGPDIKNRISHRAEALFAFENYLKNRTAGTVLCRRK